MDLQKCFCILTLTRFTLVTQPQQSNLQTLNIKRWGDVLTKNKNFYGIWLCISWEKRDKVIGPLLIKRKIYVMGQGVDQLVIGFSLSQCLRTNTGMKLEI